MSDEHPVEEPGPATPAWAAVPTMPWERVPDQRRGDLDNVPTSPPVDAPRQPYDDGRGRPQGRTYGTPRDESYWDEAPPPRRPGPPRQPQQPLPPQMPHRAGPPPPRQVRRREEEWSRGEESWGRDENWGRDEGRGRPSAPRREGPRRDGPWREESRRDEPWRDDPRRDERRDEPWRDEPRHGERRDQLWRDESRRDEPRRDEQWRDDDWRDEPRREPWREDARREDARREDARREDDWARGVDWERDDDRRHRREPEPWQEPRGRRTHPDAPTSGYPIQPTPTSAPPSPGRGRPAGGVYGGAARDIGDEPTETTGELPRVEAADEPASGAPFSVSPAGPAYTPAPLTRAGVDGLQATGYLPIVRPGAAGFPPELAAVAKTVKPVEEPEAEPEPEPAAAPDPEQMLAGFEWRFDPDTLREQIDGDEVAQLEEIRDQLTAKLNGVADNPTRARLLSLRAVVSRILGDLLKAFADGKLALAHAEATGELRRIAIAQARLAGVLQWRGEFEEADRLLTLANSSELPDRLRATMHQHAGRCAYDQGRYMEACNHFESALDLRKEEDPELIAQTELALDAVFRRVAEKGWGPYPRSREEILQIRKPPAPAFDEETQRWGFTDAEFNFCIGPGYVDVQPFRDGVAWVQRQGSETWELIDDTGRPLIDPSAGYLGVSSFSDGLAWVSRDGTTRWIAIDKANTVLISTGFDDVRPFRRGVAAVRRGHRWGAVDGVGRMVVPFQFDGFATALHDGRYIDGFSDEGLAVVSLSGRKGVVDRSGRVIVPPVHHVLMIHPVAFLVADEAQRWGALDRRGRMIIEQTFPSRMGVTDEIDRLLADTRPVI